MLGKLLLKATCFTSKYFLSVKRVTTSTFFFFNWRKYLPLIGTILIWFRNFSQACGHLYTMMRTKQRVTEKLPNIRMFICKLCIPLQFVCKKLKSVITFIAQSWWEFLLFLTSLFLFVLNKTLSTFTKPKSHRGKCNQVHSYKIAISKIIQRKRNWEMRKTMIIHTISQDNASLLSLVLMLYFFKFLKRNKSIKLIYSERNMNLAHITAKRNLLIDIQDSAAQNKFICERCIVPAVYKIYDEVQVLLRCWSCLFSAASTKYCCNIKCLAIPALQRQLLLLAGDVELNPGPYDSVIFKELLNALQPVKANYMQLGIQLNISIGELNEFVTEHRGNPENVLIQILHYWLSNSPQQNRLDNLCKALVEIKAETISCIIKNKYTNDQLKDKENDKFDNKEDCNVVQEEQQITTSTTVCTSSPISSAVQPLSSLALNPSFPPANPGIPAGLNTSDIFSNQISADPSKDMKVYSSTDTKDGDDSCDNRKGSKVVPEKQRITISPAVCTSSISSTNQSSSASTVNSSSFPVFSNTSADHDTPETSSDQISAATAMDGKVTSSLVCVSDEDHLHPRPVLFPTHNLDSVSIAKLKKDSYTLNRNYHQILMKFWKYLKDSNVDISRINWILENHASSGTIFKNHGKINDLKHITNGRELMDVIKNYCSFFNFELLESIMTEIDYDEGLKMLEVHKKNLIEYAQRRIIECPSGLGAISGEHASCYVMLDDVFNNCKVEYLFILKDDLCELLQVNVDLCLLQGVYPG